MVDEDVLLADLREDVRCGRRLNLGELAARPRDEAPLLEVISIHPVDGPQAGEVEWPGEAEDLGLADSQFVHEQLQDVGIDRRLDLQAHRGAEAASGQLPLESLQQVFGVILLDLDVLIARDAEGVVLEDVHAREEVVQVGRDDILERHKALRADSDESRQGRGHLDAGKELGPGHGIAHHDGEIQ